MSNFNISSAQIELLLALTETGSFSEAAKVLGLTQSAVSHSLARMETELGVVLVERGRRGINLTPTGAVILPYAREVLARMEMIRQVSSSAVGDAQGKIRLGIAPPFPPSLLRDIVRAFRSGYPNVELIIYEDAAAGEKPSLAEGRFDVVLAPYILPDTEKVSFVDEEVLVVFPPTHPLAEQSIIDTAVLAEEPLIMPRYGRGQISERLRLPDGVVVRLAVRHVASTTPTALVLVEAGLGVAIIAQSALKGITTELISRPFSPPLYLPIQLSIRSSDSLSPVAKAFIECAFTVRDAQSRPRL